MTAKPVPASSGVPVAASSTSTGTWALVAVSALMLGAPSVFWLFRGAPFDRRVYEQVGGASWTLADAIDAGVVDLVSALVRLAGALGTAAAILALAIAIVPYRRREPWAWYALWAIPLAATLDLAIFVGYGALSLRAALWDTAILALSVLGLVLPSGYTRAERPSSAPSTRAHEG
jgi:small-conductance mechanosensitive channel